MPKGQISNPESSWAQRVIQWKEHAIQMAFGKRNLNGRLASPSTVAANRTWRAHGKWELNLDKSERASVQQC